MDRKLKNLKEYRWRDKAAWGEGPWQSEPDKMQWIDEGTDLDCLIVRGPGGSLCGYVGVMDGHLLFETAYNDDKFYDLDVHGGVTFTDLCQEQKKEHGVCHVPAAGRSDHVWWIGFDCAHAWDYSPKFDKDMPGSAYLGVLARHLSDTVDFPDNEAGFETTYKDLDYVMKEIRELAKQIKTLYDRSVM